MAKKDEICNSCFWSEPHGDLIECFAIPPTNDGNSDTTTDMGAILRKTRRACSVFKNKDTSRG